MKYRYATPANDSIFVIDDTDNVLSVVPVSLTNGDYQRIFVSGGVIAAANTPPIIVQQYLSLDATVVTTNATPTDIFKATIPINTAYSTVATLVGIDTGNGNIRKLVASLLVKRLASTPIIVSATPVLLSNHTDGSSSTWGITTAVVANDFIIRVTGEVGRNISWILTGDITKFTPSGVV